MTAIGQTHAHRPRSRRWRVLVLALALTGAGLGFGTGAIYTNAFGVGERFEHLVDRIQLAIDPPPNRPTRQTVAVTTRQTPAPITSASPSRTAEPTPDQPASAAPTESADPTEAATPTAPPTPEPTSTPTPEPVREPVTLSITGEPNRVFAHQLTKDWCAVAGTQIVLSYLGLADNSDAFQHELAGRIGEWESWEDSHNGDWGPAAIALALAAYGAPDYEIRAYETRADALYDAALSLATMRAPVVIIAWRGAHTWIMTGYQADADPTLFTDATVTGAYIYDPWYPWVSSIWGPSDPPGTFQDAAEMERNFLPWKRPEGTYADRDGKFLLLVPTVSRA